MPWSTAIFVIAVMTLAIPLLAIWRNTPAKKARREAREQAEREKRVQGEIDDLRERVETLERIVTDSRYDLRREFETLHPGR